MIEFPTYSHPGEKYISIDAAHGALMYGIIVAQKPSVVLELGIGLGYSTRILVEAVRYNKVGEIYCVDNWIVSNGAEPPWAEELRKQGVKIIAPVEEEQFCTACQDNFCDFLFSDADHGRSPEWLHHHLRITKPNGFMFFHDTAHPDYPALWVLEERVKHLPAFHFRAKSREDEETQRGILMVINRK